MGAYTAAGMYPQTVFHADVRAREMELAAERQVGCSCSALGRMISRVITKCNGMFIFMRQNCMPPCHFL